MKLHIIDAAKLCEQVTIALCGVGICANTTKVRGTPYSEYLLRPLQYLAHFDLQHCRRSVHHHMQERLTRVLRLLQ